MILVDGQGEGEKKRISLELVPRMRQLGLQVEQAILPFGDFAFEGNGPEGTIGIGIERKTLHDMLNSIDDSRYSAHQRVGMSKLYQVSCLLVEGVWRPHDPDGTLMEGYKDGLSWKECRYGSRRTMYAKIRRYLFSVSLSGVHVIYTRDLQHTAWDVHELYHYFQKQWLDHTSLLEMQKMNIPTLSGEPSLVRKWANDIDGIGVKHSAAAEKLFKTPIALARSDEQAWLRLPRIGVATAQHVIRQILGIKKPRV